MEELEKNLTLDDSDQEKSENEEPTSFSTLYSFPGFKKALKNARRIHVKHGGNPDLYCLRPIKKHSKTMLVTPQGQLWEFIFMDQK